MPELPLLSLPAPETIDSPRRGSGGPRLIKPTRGRQAERLDPKFDRLARVVADPAQLMQLRQDPEAIAQERAVVFEVVGSLPTFYEEATRIGLEYLADDEIEIDPDEDFRLADKPDDPISGRLYLAMPDLEALRQLVRLWDHYKARRQMADGFGIWTQLFGSHLQWHGAVPGGRRGAHQAGGGSAACSPRWRGPVMSGRTTTTSAARWSGSTAGWRAGSGSSVRASAGWRRCGCASPWR